jgi:hypothetical protein
VKPPKDGSKSPEEMKDQGSKSGGLNSPTIIMASGGCKSHMGYHPNGNEWHPILTSHGEQKCIKCKCKVRKTLIKMKIINFRRTSHLSISILCNRILYTHIRPDLVCQSIAKPHSHYIDKKRYRATS